MVWWLLLSTVVAFALGFGLSLRRMRRRLQGRVTAQLEAEVRQHIQNRVIEELNSGEMRERMAAAATDAAAREKTGAGNGG